VSVRALPVGQRAGLLFVKHTHFLLVELLIAPRAKVTKVIRLLLPHDPNLTHLAKSCFRNVNRVHILIIPLLPQLLNLLLIALDGDVPVTNPERHELLGRDGAGGDVVVWEALVPWEVIEVVDAHGCVWEGKGMLFGLSLNGEQLMDE
jgi:hypothetical protein